MCEGAAISNSKAKEGALCFVPGHLDMELELELLCRSIVSFQCICFASVLIRSCSCGHIYHLEFMKYETPDRKSSR